MLENRRTLQIDFRDRTHLKSELSIFGFPGRKNCPIRNRFRYSDWKQSLKPNAILYSSARGVIIQ